MNASTEVATARAWLTARVSTVAWITWDVLAASRHLPTTAETAFVRGKTDNSGVAIVEAKILPWGRDDVDALDAALIAGACAGSATDRPPHPDLVREWDGMAHVTVRAPRRAPSATLREIKRSADRDRRVAALGRLRAWLTTDEGVTNAASLVATLDAVIRVEAEGGRS